MPNNIKDSPKNNDSAHVSETAVTDATEARYLDVRNDAQTVRQAKETATKARWAAWKTNPVVSSHLPAAAATGVAVGANITVVFSHDMDADTINDDNLFVKRGATAVAAAVTYDAGTKTATINPNSNLQAASVHTVTVKGGFNGVQSDNGEHMGADKTFNFTTA